MADTVDSKPTSEKSIGSSPILGTKVVDMRMWWNGIHASLRS